MPKLKPETKNERYATRLADFLNSTSHFTTGNTVAEKLVTAEEIKAAQTELITSGDDSALEAEAILLYFDLQGRGFTKQKCPECGKTFAYKYAVATAQGKLITPINKLRCSNECRKKGLEKLGIKWNPYKRPEERWADGQKSGIIPLIIPPSALEIVESKLQERNDDNTTPVAELAE